MQDKTKDKKWGEILLRYVRQGRYAGMIIVKTPDGWDTLIPNAKLKVTHKTAWELISYIRGYAGELT